MLIDPTKKKIAGFLCSGRPDDSGIEPVPVGTCFVAMLDNSAGEGFAYIVTAKHVVEGLRAQTDQAYVRLPAGVNLKVGGVAYIPISLEPSEWLFHPDETVDVAALPFRPLAMAGQFHFDPLHLGRLDALVGMVRRQGAVWPPLEGQDVMFLALMTLFPGKSSNTPVVRRGSIALLTDEALRGAYGSSDYHVIQAQSYPGNSGAPVFAAYGNLLIPWGVLTYGYDHLEEMKKVKDREDSYYNLGLSLVAPIAKVLDILDGESQREVREAGTGR